MRGWLPSAALAALTVAAIWGSAMGVFRLRQAVSESQDLYRLDTIGWQIESDLEFQEQQSRLASLDASRQADENVLGTLQHLRQINAPEPVNQSILDFETSWGVYAQTRGNDAFLAALGKLHALKHALKDHARAQASRVDWTLKHCLRDLAAFVTAIFIILAALMKIRRARARALLSSNQELEHAQEMDQRRVAILEMVVTHAPLARTLTAIAELPSRYQNGAGAALWSIADDALLYQVSAGLSVPVANALRSRSFERVEGTLKLDADALREIGELALRADLTQTIVPLRNVTGDAIGLLLLFAPVRAPIGEIPQRLSSQMAQLASLTIENALLYERLAFQAQHDVLTGLPNRLLFQDRVQQAILRAQRNRRKVAVLWFDLDRFKQINDTLGHRIGDELLCEFAERIKGSLRKSDTAARIGGDEFVVLVADLDGASDFRVVVEKLMKRIRLSMTVSGRELSISASAGVSVYPDHGAEPAELMRNADLAMYEAKRAGRDTFHVFQKELSDSLGRRLEVEQELKTAIEKGEFRLEYQPLIGRRDELAGFEALLRWNSRKLGSVSPAEFIPIAEDSGLILRIGEWVTRTACRDGSRWLEEGLQVPSIAVNASGLQFAAANFSEMICAALAESGFPPSKLEIEVTETALVGNLKSALQKIAHLRGLGIRFAIDDFGTGYSSLNQLRTLPVDSVKVDRSFIKDLERSSSDSITLVKGIIGMAHNLRLDVVAEGVETEGQLAILRSLGCDISQGFYLHRPLTVTAAEELMRVHAAKQHPALCDALMREPLLELVPESNLV